MTYTLNLRGLDLHHYGQGVYGWGPVSSTTGQHGRLVEWTMRSEVQSWMQSNPVFCSDAVVRHITNGNDSYRE